MRQTLLLAVLLLAVAPPALSQGVVRGMVYDSLLTRRPLEGATVIVHGTDRTATTDRQGAFVLRDLPPGRHVVGFFHPRLDSLDISAPAKEIQVEAAGTVTVTLATPSPNGASLLLCGVPAEVSTAVIFGTVRSAESDSVIAGAEASVRWHEVAIGRGGAEQSPRAVRATTDAAGRYLLCGVPNDIALTLVVRRAQQASGPLHLELDSSGVARRDVAVSLDDPAAAVRPDRAPDDESGAGGIAGTSRLEVRVNSRVGRGVRGAIVGVLGSSLSGISDDSGFVALAGLPAGSHTVVIRAIGLSPSYRIVGLASGRLRRLDVALDRFAVVLPTVAVVGAPPDRLTADIERRMRAGQGYLVTGAEVAELATSNAAWGRILGVSVGADAVGIPLMRGPLGSRCTPMIWVDGMRAGVNDGWEFRGLLLNAKRVEVYSSPNQVPGEFMTASMNACGAIAIWNR